MSLSAQKTDEFLSRQARVADQRSQETSPQLPMSRNGELPTRRPDQDHMAAFRAVEFESDACERLEDLVS